MTQLPKAYQPQEHEAKIYQLWEDSGAFKPSGHGEPFSVIMPPPNANGDLHLGHGLTIAVEDIFTRYARMRGYNTLFLPGADHAGFETQVVFERQLESQGKSRFEFSRDELYSQIWDFVQANRGNMENQVKQLGASCDWSRYTFTLDEAIIKRTHQVFKKLWDDNLIYRSKRIVNYCTFHDTSFSDLEVEHQEQQTKLWTIRYPLENGNGEVHVATTRPETMLGDTAVAVHPDDERYQSVIGQSVHLPLVERPVPIVADAAVDPSFGTGAVKVTPAHDETDFNIGKRHNLPIISIVGSNGKITDEAPAKYRNLEVLAARQAVVEDLKSGDFLVKEQKHKNKVGVCYKCGNVIEPLVRDQWFIDMQPLATAAIAALDAGRIDIYPKSKLKVLRDWYENLHDWNISRQIAWGIPIPAFVNARDSEDWIFDSRTDMETIELNGQVYHRDPDVFDTWFSSGQWPFNTLGYPDGEDFQAFYPTTIMETGADILFWWVSRMIMLGLYVTGEVPFKKIYLHGMVLDEHGQKMSKSRGNGISPQELINGYGADATRAGLISGRSPGQNQSLDPAKLIASRNFANKLWNVARFTLDQLDDDYQPAAPEPNNLVDHWMIAKLQQTVDRIGRDLEQFNLSQAWEQVYELLWSDFADWYIESSKVEPNQDVLVYSLETILKLTHPFMPFVTETLWQQLPWRDDLLITAEWPESKTKPDKEALTQFGELQTIIGQVRAIAADIDLKGSILYHHGDPLLEENAKLISKLARLDGCDSVSDGRGLPVPGTAIECWLDVDEETLNSYRQTLQQRQANIDARIKSLESRLANKSYTHGAPKEVVNETRGELKQAQARSQTLSEQLNHLDLDQKNS